MPETTFKFLSRCLLYATCNHVLVENFGNIKTEEKWHDLNLTINETESPVRRAECRLCFCTSPVVKIGALKLQKELVPGAMFPARGTGLRKIGNPG